MRRTIAIGFAVFLSAFAASMSAALAQSCSAAIENLSFGTVNLTTGAAFDTTANIQITCSGTAGSTVRVCPNIGAGSGGAPGGSPRLMTGAPGGQLAYNIFQDSNHNVVWGSALGGTGSATPPVIDIVLDGSGAGSQTRTLYGRVLGGQQTVAPASFSSSIAGSDATVASAYADTNPTCAAIGTSNATMSSLTASATYNSTCTISAGSMSFGNLTSTLAAIDTDATITARCSATTPYAVAMDGGQTAASNPLYREMQKGSDRLIYGIYQDGQRTQAWGAIPNANTVSGTGTGSNVLHAAYGRIQPQPTPPSGTYSDTVIVTIDY